MIPEAYRTTMTNLSEVSLSSEEKMDLLTYLVNENQKLSDENSRMVRELQGLEQVQKASLPESAPYIKGYDTGFSLANARISGGDACGFILPPTGRVRPEDSELAIFMVDAVDKGAPAAAIAILLTALFKARAFQFDTPGKTILQVNLDLMELVHDDRLTATAIYAVIYPKTGIIDYVRMAANRPIVYDQYGRRITLPSQSGIWMNFDIAPDVDEGKLTLPHGGKIFFISDGITEAPNIRDEEFGEDNFDELVRTNWQLSVQEICNLILASVRLHSSHLDSLYDDSTVIGVARN